MAVGNPDALGRCRLKCHVMTQDSLDDSSASTRLKGGYVIQAKVLLLVGIPA
jgi:hypothetical protein